MRRVGSRVNKMGARTFSKLILRPLRGWSMKRALFVDKILILFVVLKLLRRLLSTWWFCDLLSFSCRASLCISAIVAIKKDNCRLWVFFVLVRAISTQWFRKMICVFFNIEDVLPLSVFDLFTLSSGLILSFTVNKRGSYFLNPVNESHVFQILTNCWHRF